MNSNFLKESYSNTENDNAVEVRPYLDRVIVVENREDWKNSYPPFQVVEATEYCSEGYGA